MSDRAAAGRLSSLFWLAIVVAHAIAAVIWWWMMPAGFPLMHPRFFLHRVIPWVFVAFAIAHLVPRITPLRPALLAAIPATYLSAAIAGRLLFPVTLERLWLAPLGVGLTLLVVWLREHRAHSRRAIAFALPAAALGWFLAFAHDAPAPSTHPANVAMPAPLASGGTHGVVSLSALTDVAASTGSVRTTAGPLSIEIHPMLSFISRSPDGCWTLLAPTADRVGPRRRVTAVESSDHRLRADYAAGNERSTLDVRADDRGVHVETLAELPDAVYSHLSSFSYITIEGHRRLFVSFSPAPDARIEVLPSDYPTGRPARFAYVDAARAFHVVQASDAEKGPYTDLAVGRLAPGEPVAITLFDEQTPIARITLDDYAAQASTELSPTAGWNVPQNDISFSLSGDAPVSPAAIYMTLAGTGVGRGFDSVAHAAGVYRNRIRIEPL